MLFSLLAIGAILGPPISGIINTATHGYVAMGFYAGAPIVSLVFPSLMIIAGSAVLVGVVLMLVCRTLITGRLIGGKI
jgi:MFS transporter, MCT family, solute carrier family 16 (monocarboxylic acid transporters), member 10